MLHSHLAVNNCLLPPVRLSLGICEFNRTMCQQFSHMVGSSQGHCQHLQAAIRACRMVEINFVNHLCSVRKAFHAPPLQIPSNIVFRHACSHHFQKQSREKAPSSTLGNSKCVQEIGLGNRLVWLCRSPPLLRPPSSPLRTFPSATESPHPCFQGRKRLCWITV